jgi:hypothetical protein
MAIITLNNNSLSGVTALPAGVGGKVLQTVINPNNGLSQFGTSSTSLVDVGTDLDISLTPTSSSTKIIIWTNFSYDAGGNGNTISASLSSIISASQTQLNTNYPDYGDGTQGAIRIIGWIPHYYIHLHSTTNTITYRMQIKSGNGSAVYFNKRAYKIIAQEIAV